MHLRDTDIQSGTLPLASNVSLLQMGFFSLSSTLLGQGWGWDTETGHRETGGADSIRPSFRGLLAPLGLWSNC